MTGFDEVVAAVFIGDDIDDPEQGNDAAFFRYEERHGYDPAFDLEQPLGDSHDAAFLVTDAPFPATPIAMNRLAPPAVGTTMHLVGFGRRDSTDQSSFGKRLMTDAPIAGEEGGHLIFQDSGLCGGDSGGPSLWKRGDASYVAGIHSYVEHVDSCVGKGYDLTVGADVLAYIDPVIEDADPGFLATQPPQESEAGSGGGDGATTSSSATVSTTGATTPTADASAGSGGSEAGSGGSDGAEDDDGGCTVASLVAARPGGVSVIAIALAAWSLRLRRRRAR